MSLFSNRAKANETQWPPKPRLLLRPLQEFAQLGLAGARIDEIARTARVNKALLYYYFESKEHLFLGAVEQMFAAMTGALRSALNTAKEPREKLLAFLDANFKVLAAQPAYARLLEQEMDIVKVFVNSFKADEAPRFFQQITPLLTEFRAVLEEGVKSGAFRKMDIDAVLPLLLMLVRTAVRGIPMAGKFISASRKVSAKRRRAAAIDFITCALFTVQSKEQNGSQPESSR